MYSPAFRTMMAAALGVFALFASPSAARAGHYELVSETPTGSGSVTTTCNNSSSSHYPGYTRALSEIAFAAATAYGTIECAAEETWKFRWVPDEGKTVEEDPPTGDQWEIDYHLVAEFICHDNSEWSTASGSGYGTVTLSSETTSDGVTASCTLYPVEYDPDTGAFQSARMEGGTQTKWVTFQFVLFGENPEVTFRASASGSVSGALDLGLAIVRETPPRPAGEAIWHTYPAPAKKGKEPVVPEGPLQVRGKWRGLSGRLYAIEHEWQAPAGGTSSGGRLGLVSNVPGSTGINQSWAAGFRVDARGMWHHKVYLMTRDGRGMYTIQRANSVVSFWVSEAIVE